MGRAGLRRSDRPRLQDENTAAGFFGIRGFLRGKFGGATYSSATDLGRDRKTISLLVLHYEFLMRKISALRYSNFKLN